MSHVLNHLIQQLAKLPGLGPRSGRRIALYLLKRRTQVLEPLMRTLSNAHEHLHPCGICGLWDETNPCHFCTDPKRESRTLCVVAEMGDVWAIERSGFYAGKYHILGGVLSIVEGVTPESLTLAPLVLRCQNSPPEEVILALPQTVEGQTTAHYVTQELSRFASIRFSSLARGIPMGGELDYLDDGTLTAAFLGRKQFLS